MLVHACYENYVFDIEKLQRASPDMSEQFNQQQIVCKVGFVVPMAIWSEFRMEQYRDDDHREYAPHFGKLYSMLWSLSRILSLELIF